MNVNMHVLAPLLCGLILVGCVNGVESDAALAGANPAAAVAPTTEQPDPIVPDAADPAEEKTTPPDAETFASEVDHVFFPLTPGTRWTYEGDSEGMHRRDEILVLAKTTVIADFTCTAVYQEVFLDGELTEMTTEWFAQDGAGNVWKFGEESLEFDGAQFRKTEDSWLAGVDGAHPWMILAADPRVGDVYTSGDDTMEVVSLNETASVPAGDFENCMMIVENDDDPDDTDIIIYSPGTGPVSEQSPTGRIELVGTR